MRQVNAVAWNKNASFAATKAWWRSLVSVDFYTYFFFVLRTTYTSTEYSIAELILAPRAWPTTSLACG